MNIYIIAEIGINHDGDIRKAERLVHAAYVAGADAVKFQYRNPNNCYLTTSEIGDEILAREIKKCSLSPEHYQNLTSYAKTLSLDVGLSFFLDQDIYDFEESFLSGLDFFKIPSPELLNDRLIDQLLKYNKKLLCSTGAHDQNQIDQFISKYSCKSDQIAILHCVSNYPLQPSNSRLGYIKYLSKNWKGEIGYSSHDIQPFLCGVAVAFGATVIERHITTGKDAVGLDHSSSSTKEEFAELVDFVRTTQSAIAGDEPRIVNQGEALNLQNLGRSFYASRDIEIGECIAYDDLLYRTPRVSISYDKINQYLDKPLIRKLDAGEPLTVSHFVEHTSPGTFISKTLQEKYSSRILVPARLHDLEKLRNHLGHNAYELHLSYEESLSNIQLSKFKSDEFYSIHIPDYIDSTHLIDPFATDVTVRQRSIQIIGNLINLAKQLFNLTGRRIPIVGSFSVHHDTDLFYKQVSSLCSLHCSTEYTLCIQILPPFAWYFGGSCRTNVFDSMHSFMQIKKYNIPICLDLSHLIMSSNYYRFDLVEAFNLLLPHILHQHISGAVGIDGEGTPLSSLQNDQRSILSSMLTNQVYSVIEVWQGHLNLFSGFRSELEFLSQSI